MSTVTELRAGHLQNGNFVAATAFVNFGQEPIPNRSLINLDAICPAAQETLTNADPIRALRLTVNVLGDGYVSAINGRTLQAIGNNQPVGMQGSVVLMTENGLRNRTGRFGWKDQHASLLAFNADAYLNEMGISNRMSPNQDDVTHQCDTVPDPEDVDDDIDVFMRFIQATKAPPRDTALAATAAAQAGSQLFDQIGCSICHVRTIVTAPPGEVHADGPVPDCLGNKIIHPFSDFLLHDIGTGDGIVQTGGQGTRLKMRTAPLWGLRTHPLFMHDGGSSTISDAIQRHGGQAGTVRTQFNSLSATQKQQVLTFLNSL
ncbi:MAG TPA: di-heme oxidoredictase family protein [Thermoanaerobaculia bacterium]|nr:di-heme oxidoredictase family protein [Thermoanaerobaculia bacterium]